MRKLILASVLLSVSANGWAAPASSAAPATFADPIGSGAVLELVLGLVAVIALILSLAWIVRRINVLPGQQAGLQVVAVLPLGQRERAVLVQVGEQQLLLGVSASQVSLLERFETPVIEPRRSPNGAFAKRLQDVLSQRGSRLSQKQEQESDR
ncbi:MAG: flagellar biosynthetic protein FliO [Oceanospirillales bacterium]|nr:flagellar biosynthetic protein FliO [Oceanospirillales bacterium]